MTQRKGFHDRARRKVERKNPTAAVIVTLRDALEIALHAYDEDEAEREAIVEALAPILLGTAVHFRAALAAAWRDSADEIREEIAAYQVQRAEIDAEAAADA